jgi:cytochrome c556
MKKLASCCGALCALSLCVSLAAANRPEDPATIKEVMKALHKGADAPVSQLKNALKSDSPDWKVVQEAAKVYAKHSPDLVKNDPPKGEKADFEKLAKAFNEQSEKLNKAAKDQNLADARAAFGKLSTSCMDCHKAHKP